MSKQFIQLGLGEGAQTFGLVLIRYRVMCDCEPDNSLVIRYHRKLGGGTSRVHPREMLS